MAWLVAKATRTHCEWHKRASHPAAPQGGEPWGPVREDACGYGRAHRPPPPATSSEELQAPPELQVRSPQARERGRHPVGKPLLPRRPHAAASLSSEDVASAALAVQVARVRAAVSRDALRATAYLALAGWEFNPPRSSHVPPPSGTLRGATNLKARRKTHRARIQMSVSGPMCLLCDSISPQGTSLLPGVSGLLPHQVHFESTQVT